MGAEHDGVALVGDRHVVVAWIDGTAEEPLVLRGIGLDGLDLLGSTDQTRGPEPEKVVAQQLTDRAVGLRDGANHLVGRGPILAAATVLDGTEQRDEPGVLEQLNLCGRKLTTLVASNGVDSEQLRYLTCAGNPSGSSGGSVGPVLGECTIFGSCHDAQ